MCTGSKKVKYLDIATYKVWTFQNEHFLIDDVIIIAGSKEGHNLNIWNTVLEQNGINNEP